MAQQVVLFHSALGLNAAVLDWANSLRAAGHRVWTPDLYDGETFERIEDGIRKRDALGVPELISRARAAVTDLPPGLVLAGFSLGAGAAECLTATGVCAQAAVLMHGAFALADLGAEAWPRGVPVQVHYAEDDPWIDRRGVSALEASVHDASARADVHVYPVGGHLFADASSDDYNPHAADLMRERFMTFLAQL